MSCFAYDQNLSQTVAELEAEAAGHHCCCGCNVCIVLGAWSGDLADELADFATADYDDGAYGPSND